MTRRKKILLSIFIPLLAILLFIAGGFLFLTTPAFKHYAEGEAGTASGRKVGLKGDIKIHWSWVPRVTLSGVEVGNAKGFQPDDMISADRIEFTIALKELLKGRLVLPELNMIAPKIFLAKDEEGNANWNLTKNPAGKVATAPAPNSRSGMPIIGKLYIENGELSYQDPKEKIAIDAKISTLKEEGNEDQMRLEGSGKYNDKPFVLDMTGGSILDLRESKKPYPVNAKMTIGQTEADISGTLEDPVKMSGMDINLDLSGASAADLFPIIGIALPPTPVYHVNGHLTEVENKWSFQNFAGKMGGSDLEGNLVWDTSSKRPMLTGNILAHNLDFKDLGGLIGVKTRPDEKEAQKQSQYLIPDTPLDIGRMKSMDAKVDFDADSIKAPQLLDNFHMSFDLKEGVLKLAPIKFGMSEGDMSGNLQIDGNKDPIETKTDMDFSRISLHRLFAPIAKKLDQKNVSQGYLGGTAKLKGYGKSMREMLAHSGGMVGLGMEGGELSDLLMQLIGLDIFKSLGFIVSGDKPVAIRCIIADFSVKNGIMHANRFVVDTADTNIIGKGEIAFATEKADLTLMPYPKHPSALSVRAAIIVKGSLKNLSVYPDPAAVAIRGGIAGGLAAIFPVGAILAFIEPGLGKDSDCASFVRALQKETGDKIPVNSNAPL